MNIYIYIYTYIYTYMDKTTHLRNICYRHYYIYIILNSTMNGSVL